MQPWRLDEKQTIPCPKCGNKLIPGFEMTCYNCYTTYGWDYEKLDEEPHLVEKKRRGCKRKVE